MSQATQNYIQKNETYKHKLLLEESKAKWSDAYYSS
jgi:hypothetical protein